MKTTWEEELEEIVAPIKDSNYFNRYELRPRLSGPVIYCTTCSKLISDELQVCLGAILEEAQVHEENNHDG